MAKVGDNMVTTGLSGKLGNLLVFRNRNGKTYVAKAPRERTGEPSEAQKQHQAKFQQAIIYGRGAIADPATKAAYQASAEGGQTAFNVAVADFFNAPHIDEVDVSNYTGQPGSFIRIRAVDDFNIAEVTVTIQNGDSSEVESGAAQPEDGMIWWRYTATANNESLEGDKIIIRVSDVPGNITEEEKGL
ncbi:hypothetical protein PbJCM13498_20460 [Prolixibacter bellariivorans]|uniref:Uncharacterized protein n=1 Tax=Prolixibacter bellariivorans TaxID=314319 RepID=A0A5M4B005_9BACT|nr:hypothetical protein [Prolixibacter bellariivorans]GET33183.1 hypothetical protein PbJCM13498_20460 [Prolixibacter bellariivorans]